MAFIQKIAISASVISMVTILLIMTSKFKLYTISKWLQSL